MCDVCAGADKNPRTLKVWYIRTFKRNVKKLGRSFLGSKKRMDNANPEIVVVSKLSIENLIIAILCFCGRFDYHSSIIFLPAIVIMT